MSRPGSISQHAKREERRVSCMLSARELRVRKIVLECANTSCFTFSHPHMLRCSGGIILGKLSPQPLWLWQIKSKRENCFVQLARWRLRQSFQGQWQVLSDPLSLGRLFATTWRREQEEALRSRSWRLDGFRMLYLERGSNGWNIYTTTTGSLYVNGSIHWNM